MRRGRKINIELLMDISFLNFPESKKNYFFYLIDIFFKIVCRYFGIVFLCPLLYVQYITAQTHRPISIELCLWAS